MSAKYDPTDPIWWKRCPKPRCRGLGHIDRTMTYNTADTGRPRGLRYMRCPICGHTWKVLFIPARVPGPDEVLE